jgi:hypothetical protein
MEPLGVGPRRVRVTIVTGLSFNYLAMTLPGALRQIDKRSTIQFAFQSL